MRVDDPAEPPSTRLHGESLIRGVLALADAGLRVAYLVDVVRRTPPEVLAPVLDVLCARAEQAEPAARSALVSVVDALASGTLSDALQRLREEAVGQGLLALDRLIRPPPVTLYPESSRGGDDERGSESGGRVGKVVADARGRTLTLGERKALARKPDRSVLARLLLDPHPDVIRKLLANPTLTEDDVLRLITRRPGRADVLLEIARAPRWLHRSRIRRALVLHPDTPPDLALRLCGLLLRQELKLVLSSTHVPQAVRAVCLEHLARRPPGPTGGLTDDEDDPPLQ